MRTQEEYAKLKKSVCPISFYSFYPHLSPFPRKKAHLFSYFKISFPILLSTYFISAPIQTTSNSSTSGAQNEDAAKEIASLKKQLEQAKKTQRDFGAFYHPVPLPYLLILTCLTDILKKQASQNSAEYDRLATELNAITGQDGSNKRVD